MRLRGESTDYAISVCTLDKVFHIQTLHLKPNTITDLKSFYKCQETLNQGYNKNSNRE